jgi:hypothetical protein
MKFLSFSDLQTRWGYTRAGIHNLAKKPNFPLPFAIVSNGKIKIFQVADIEAYEQGKPWLFDENQKQQRRRLFGLLSMAKAEQPEQKNILKHAFGKKAQDWKQ